MKIDWSMNRKKIDVSSKTFALLRGKFMSIRDRYFSINDSCHYI